MHPAPLLALMAAALTAAPDDIRREGGQEYRQKVDALELAPLPDGAIEALSDWTGAAPAAEALAAGPALYVTWASWYSSSFSGLTLAQKLHDRYAEDGLIVVGVHHPTGYDKAADVLEKRNITFPVAHDAGAFREAVLTDVTGPDFYIVDRAGNLRFADVATSAIEDAVELVMTESAEAAAGVPQQKRDAAEQAARDAGKTRSTDGLKPGQLLSVPFDLPPASEYSAARWPAHNSGDRLSAANFQGKPLPKALGSETYLSDKPDTKGRLVVVDFWATWCPPCRRAMPKLDDLQAQHPQDLVIIGISDEPRQKVEGYLRTNPHDYTQAVDQKRTLSTPLQIRGIPHVLIISTDDVIRWQGNPLDPNFNRIVEECLKADPGVKARQKAEQEHLKAQST